MGDVLTIQRAAGAALRSLRRPGFPPERVAAGVRGEPLRPQLAIDALVAAARARFDLPEDAAELFAPALVDWRDAVGCADPVLVPRNAKAEKALVPLPMPSWCAWLADCGVLRLEGAPALAGPRVVQH